MQDWKFIIAKNITALRQNRKMTQAELAEKLNYSDKAVSKWERGESVPDVLVLKSIADMFGVSLDYLLEADHEEKPKPSQESPGYLHRAPFLPGRRLQAGICQSVKFQRLPKGE